MGRSGREGTSDREDDAMVREFLAAWERRDTDHIVGAFADDAVYHSVPLAPIVGKEAIGAWVAGFEGVATRAPRGAAPGGGPATW